MSINPAEWMGTMLPVPVWVAVIGGVGIFYTAYKASLTHQQVTLINGALAKEAKSHEHALKHLDKIAEKRIEVANVFMELAARLVKVSDDFASTAEDDWTIFREFTKDWMNAMPLYIWLPETRQVDYMNIMRLSLGVSQQVMLKPEAQRQKELADQLKLREADFYNMAMGFIEGMRHDFADLNAQSGPS